MDKKQREERRRQEDIALQRGLLWVAGAMVLEALLVLVNRFYINFTLTDAGVNAYLALGKWLPVLRNVTLIGAALALVWTVLQLKKGGKRESGGNVLEQLEKLSQMKDAGILSEEEFTAKKAVLLAKL